MPEVDDWFVGGSNACKNVRASTIAADQLKWFVLPLEHGLPVKGVWQATMGQTAPQKRVMAGLAVWLGIWEQKPTYVAAT